MRALGRSGLIALTLLALSLPAASLCEAMGDWMEDCGVAMSSQMSHDMADCDRGDSIMAACCGDSGDSPAEPALNRRGDTGGLEVAAAYAQPVGPTLTQPVAVLPPDAVPRGEPPRYRVLSTLLL